MAGRCIQRPKKPRVLSLGCKRSAPGRRLHLNSIFVPRLWFSTLTKKRPKISKIHKKNLHFGKWSAAVMHRSWYVINRPRHAKPPVCSINTADLGILRSFGGFGDKLSFSLELLLSLLLLLQLLPLLLLLQLQCSFLTEKQKSTFDSVYLHPSAISRSIC